MKTIVVISLSALVFSCKQKKQTSVVNQSNFSKMEVVVDTNKNIVMTKSGIADSNNFRNFKFYDTTGRLVFVIEWGGMDSLRKMISPQIVDTGTNTILAGKYLYAEYLANVFGASRNFQQYIDDHSSNKSMAFHIIDSIIFKNHKFNLSQSEFDNLLNYLK